MKLLRLILPLIIAAASSRATTVIPPTFDQLVADAEMILEGTVKDVRSEWTGAGNERRIVSYITFKVHDVIKGAPGDSFTMQMLGGTVGDDTMQVADAPRFKVGDHDILFVEHNGTQFVPLVGIMHGRYRIQHDGQSGRDVVLTNEGLPLGDISKLGNGSAAAAAAREPGEAITPASLKSAIKARLGATR